MNLARKTLNVLTHPLASPATFVLSMAAIVLFALLHGCQSLGIPSASTFNEKVTVGYAAVTTVRMSALSLLNAKTITPSDAQNVQDQANNIRAGLDIARQTYAVDPSGAQSKLASVLTALNGLQSYIATRSQH